MSLKRMLLLLVAVFALAGVAAGCGNDEEKQSTSSSSSQTEEGTSQKTSDAGVETAAAELRAGLTAQLQEHVYLAGIAVANGVGNGLDSKEFKAAAGTLDENSKQLSESVGSVYGADAGEQFLALWRKHIGFFVDYTKAKATGDDAGMAKAKKDLDGYRSDFGAFLASANPNLTKEAVADELKGHVETVFATIDAVVEKGDVYGNLRKAASHMPGTANVLAGAIAKQKPDMFDGSAEAGAAELRAGLTALLQEHVYLAGLAVNEGVNNGLDSKGFKAAAGELDENSKGLSDAIGSVYGDDAGKQFLALWRKHIGFFVDYTAGKAGKDDAKVEKAKQDLDGYRSDFGAFLASANPNLTKEAVAEELGPHVETLFAAIDAVVAKDTAAFDELKKAADHMPGTAKILSGAIAKQFPDKFPSA